MIKDICDIIIDHYETTIVFIKVVHKNLHEVDSKLVDFTLSAEDIVRYAKDHFDDIGYDAAQEVIEAGNNAIIAREKWVRALRP